MLLNGSLRWITSRRLARCSREVLDELERTGTRVVVVRHGLPIAMISPVGEVAQRAEVEEILSTIPADERKPVDAPAPAEVCLDVVSRAALESVDKAVLLAADATPRLVDALAKRARVPEVSQVGTAVGRLEVKGLLRRVSGRYSLTSDGAHVRVALQEARADDFSVEA